MPNNHSAIVLSMITSHGRAPILAPSAAGVLASGCSDIDPGESARQRPLPPLRAGLAAGFLAGLAADFTAAFRTGAGFRVGVAADLPADFGGVFRAGLRAALATRAAACSGRVPGARWQTASMLWPSGSITNPP